MTQIRAFLDRLPTPVKVALWLALSGTIASIAQALTNGTIVVDARTLAVVNIVLMLARELADQMAPKATGAKPAAATGELAKT